ncbi:hypothetical protein EU524_01605 [Candidatus Thorarchaeota archaeon]|nr:MAG: hypothetical protein EU524_01605 [Candidatus Thorarchaeota archaeon]
MSNYERNTGMVACIIGVLVVGAIAVGALSYFGSTTWNLSQATTDFSFDAGVGATTGTVTLDVDLDAGGVAITFVDNASLLYQVDLEVLNTTLANDGAPSVSFASNVISFDYTAAGANITLGSGVNYTMDINVGGGGLELEFTDGAHLSDVNATVGGGGIVLILTDDVVLVETPTFSFDIDAGGLDLTVDLPTDVGGSFECAVTFGGVDITAPGWTQVTTSHYETADYDTAPQSLTIIAQVGGGGVSATLT